MIVYYCLPDLPLHISSAITFRKSKNRTLKCEKMHMVLSFWQSGTLKYKVLFLNPHQKAQILAQSWKKMQQLSKLVQLFNYLSIVWKFYLCTFQANFCKYHVQTVVTHSRWSIFFLQISLQNIWLFFASRACFIFEL